VSDAWTAAASRAVPSLKVIPSCRVTRRREASTNSQPLARRPSMSPSVVTRNSVS